MKQRLLHGDYFTNIFQSNKYEHDLFQNLNILVILSSLVSCSRKLFLDITKNEKIILELNRIQIKQHPQ